MSALPPKPNLAQLKRQAAELRRQARAGSTTAIARIRAHHPGYATAPDMARLPVRAAQLVIAREHGFPSWPRLKRHIETLGEELQQLIAAVQHRSVDELAALLAAQPDLAAYLDEPLWPFATPALHGAVAAGDREFVDLLLDLGADPNRRSEWWAGGSGVLHSLPRPDQGLAAHLIARGAKLDVHAAAGLGRRDALDRMLDASPGQVNARGPDGHGPLRFAADTDTADLLLDRGADPEIRDLDHDGTPVQWLVCENPMVCRHLIARGAAADLFVHCALGDVERVRQAVAADPGLLTARAGADRDAPGGYVYGYTLGHRLTLLAVAARCDRPQVIDALAAAGADLDDTRMQGSTTALHHAADTGRLAAARRLLDLGADPNIRDRYRQATPQAWARHRGHEEVAELLHRRGGR